MGEMGMRNGNVGNGGNGENGNGGKGNSEANMSNVGNGGNITREGKGKDKLNASSSNVEMPLNPTILAAEMTFTGVVPDEDDDDCDGDFCIQHD